MSGSGRWLGIHVKSDGAITASAAIELARHAEERGFSGVTMNEDVGHDVFATLGAMSTRTATIGIGSAIANVYCRTPMQLAMAAATVDELSSGRMMLGISVGHHPWVDRYHGVPLEAPLARLGEYVSFLRAAFRGERFQFDGRFYRGVEAKIGFPLVRRDLPIYVGGDRARILELSAKIADGSIMNVVPASYIANFAAEQYFSSARRAGRDPSTLELVGVVTCCVDQDRNAAIDAAKHTFIQRLRSNPAKVIELRPRVAAELEQISALIRGGDLDRAIAEIPVEIVTDTIAAGSPGEVRKVLDDFYRAGCTRVLASIFPRTPERLIAAMDALSPLADVELV